MMLHYSGTIESKTCYKNVEEQCPKLTQQYSTGWMEKNWKAYLHAMSMISSGEAQRISNRLLSKRFDTFKVGKEESKTFQYIGMELLSDGNTILLHQSKYGESLESISLEKSRVFQKHEVMSAQEKQAYRSMIGQILWTSRQSRPDVVFDACQFASKIKDGKVEHLMEANKVIRRIKSEQVDLKFHNLESGQLSLLVYTDASLGNLLAN